MICADEKTKLEEDIGKTLEWFDYNLSVERDEFEKKQKDLEVIVMHIIKAISDAKTSRMRR